MKRLIWIAFGALWLAMLLSAGPAVAHPRRHARMRPIEGRLRSGRGQVDSTNWSGYAAYGTTFTNVKGSWTEPAASCESVRANGYTLAAFWVGLDGYESNTVEQIGTEADCTGTSAHYYAWYELYPERLYVLEGDGVLPGDVLHAEVSQTTLRLIDVREGKVAWESSIPYVDKQFAFSSAEWIAEGPVRGHLTDFGTVQFEEATASSSEVSNGSINDAAGWSNDAITLVSHPGPRGNILAMPSELGATGTAFSITARLGGEESEEGHGHSKGKGVGRGSR